jgi:2-polyprenyl-6-methoxyphenol hydroxylase-like FAD-dependent oxidoreductase
MERASRAVQCGIVGGGPAGMMLGFLLARAGIEVAVLEKHADFLRDFRGDTIHPSTADVMAEVGVLDEFLARPHNEVRQLSGILSGVPFRFADFSHVPARCKFVILMPQWDFLNFLAEKAQRYPTFHLLMSTKAEELLIKDGRVAGIIADSPDGKLEVRAPLTVAADGRDSIVREKAGLDIIAFGAPMDVLWMRISRRDGDPAQAFGFFAKGTLLAMFDRGAYWQCAFVIPKGSFDSIQRAGLDGFQQKIAASATFLGERVRELDAWEKIKLLTVRVDRLREWYRDGLLCIGDAAHAMSPIGGVGINLAIQDAVAAANILCRPLQTGSTNVSDLQAVQQRRMFPTKMTQGLQLFIQKRVVTRVIDDSTALAPPRIVNALNKLPILQSIAAYVVGIGFRPEHVRTADLYRDDAIDVKDIEV